MCDYCSTISLKDFFRTPKDYEKTIEYISELIENHGFIMLESNCEVGKHKNENGQWVDDIIFHIIKCPKCGQKYSCVVNAYRGGGAFKKG